MQVQYFVARTLKDIGYVMMTLKIAPPMTYKNIKVKSCHATVEPQNVFTNSLAFVKRHTAFTELKTYTFLS